MIRGDTGAGGLVAPLPCTAYFSKLAILIGCASSYLVGFVLLLCSALQLQASSTRLLQCLCTKSEVCTRTGMSSMSSCLDMKCAGTHCSIVDNLLSRAVPEDHNTSAVAPL